MSDLRYALRTLTRSPGFAGIAILSLALGIGANVAIYSAVRAALLDPLPVRAPEELVAVAWAPADDAPTRGILSSGSTGYRDPESGVTYRSNVSHALYRAFRQTAGSEVFAFSYVGLTSACRSPPSPWSRQVCSSPGTSSRRWVSKSCLAAHSPTRTIDRTPRLSRCSRRVPGGGSSGLTQASSAERFN